MSFLLDPPLLFASGVLIERALPQERRDVAEAATLGVFFGGSFGLYNNVPGSRAAVAPVPRPQRPRLHVEQRRFRREHHAGNGTREWPLHAAAGGIFATYPFFLKLGRKLGRRK